MRFASVASIVSVVAEKVVGGWGGAGMPLFSITNFEHSLAAPLTST